MEPPISTSNTTCSPPSSSISSSSASAFTSTSSSTVWGPGALFGKFLLGFGKSVLRAVEYVVIRRRLKAISSQFPHNDNDSTIRDLERMYDDILEVMRPGLYSKSLRRKAIPLVLKQIAIRQTSDLVKALLKWPQDEMRLIISEITFFLRPNRTGSFEEQEQEQVKLHATIASDDIYRSRITLDLYARHMMEDYFAKKIALFATAPLLQFIGRLTEASSLSLRTIFDPQSLDVLLRTYLCDFLPSLYPLQDKISSNSSSSSRERQIAVINSALAKYRDRDISQITINDPSVVVKLSLIPQYLPFAERRRLVVVPEQEQDRKHRTRAEIWRHAEREVIALRLHTIGQVMMDPKPPKPHSELEDEVFVAYLDLVEFSSSDSYGVDIKTQAGACLDSAIDQSIYPAIGSIFSHEQDAVVMFSGLVSRVLPKIETSYIHPNQAKHRLQVTPRSRSQPERIHYLFLEFVIDCAAASSLNPDPKPKQVLHRAGVMTFLLAMLKAELGQFLNNGSSTTNGTPGGDEKLATLPLLPLIRQLYIRPTWIHSLGDVLKEDWASLVWSDVLLRGFDVMKRKGKGGASPPPPPPPSSSSSAPLVAVDKHCICCEEEWSMFGVPCTKTVELFSKPEKVFSSTEAKECCYTCPDW